jgi:hypothetical protein
MCSGIVFFPELRTASCYSTNSLSRRLRSSLVRRANAGSGGVRFDGRLAIGGRGGVFRVFFTWRPSARGLDRWQSGGVEQRNDRQHQGRQ